MRSNNRMKRPPDINDAQWRAVNHPAEHLLIVAGPGTGKTHTLTRRIARNAGDLPPGRKILAVTFTNKAAGEMKDRLAALVPARLNNIFTGTFHQFCLAVLRDHAAEFNGGKQVSVAPEDALQRYIRSLNESRDAAEAIIRWKAVSLDRECPGPVARYNAWLRERSWLDFDDILRETLFLLIDRPDIRRETRSLYTQIFVDEYQDINPVQHALLRTIAGPGNRLTAIGDPNQAVYGFRGADVGYFESFEDDFPGAERCFLEENYRSAAGLLAASGQVIAGSRFTVPPLTAKIIRQGRLTVHAAPTDKAEAEYVVHQIEKLVGGTSLFSQDSGRVGAEDLGEMTFGDIAVLYRLRAQARPLKEALDRSGIPYHVSGKEEMSSAEDRTDIPSGGIVEPEVEPEKVTLMTLHAAKGLEFPVVFVVGCEENLLPLNILNMAADEEEERRLFYVGMTRAGERLFLVRAAQRVLFGKALRNAPSRFLSKIKEELIERDKARTRKTKKTETQIQLFG